MRIATATSSRLIDRLSGYSFSTIPAVDRLVLNQALRDGLDELRQGVLESFQSDLTRMIVTDNLYGAHIEFGDVAAGRREMTEMQRLARRLEEYVAGRGPSDQKYVRRLPATLDDRLGNLYTLEGDFPAARLAQGRHLAHYDREALTTPDDPDVVINQAGGCRNLATIELTCERDHEAALPYLIRGRNLMQRLAPSGVLDRVPVLRQQLAWMDRHVSFCQREVPDAIATNLDRVANRPDAIMLLTFRGHWLARHDRVGDAAATATRLQSYNGSPVVAQFEAARILARAAAHGGPHANQHAGDAVAALTRAVNFGFRNNLRLRNDPAFEPLRGREDFQKLLADLEAKFPPMREVLPAPRRE